MKQETLYWKVINIAQKCVPPELFESLGINSEAKEFKEAINGEIKERTISNRIWKLSLFHRLFCDEFNLLSFEKEVKVIDLIEKVKSEFSGNKTVLSQKPRIVCLSEFKKGSTIKDKLKSNWDFWDVIFFFPEHGIILESLRNKNTPRIFEKERLKKHKIRALENSRAFSAYEQINSLRIATQHEIAGFSGLDHIEFVGEDVKKGLRGLQIRQEIKVNLENMGPKLSVSTPNLQMKIGGGVKIKNFNALQEIHEIFLI